MKFIKQTYSGKDKGDCFPACVASLIGCNITDIPACDSTPDGVYWIDHVNQYLKRFGYYILSARIESNENRIKGHYIAAVPSLNFEGQTHSIICKDGICIWDPTNCYKSYQGQKVKVETVDLLIPLFLDEE